MAAQQKQQESLQPVEPPKTEQLEVPQAQQAFPEPIKPRDQQWAGQPGGYVAQPQYAPPDNTHLLIAWILFGSSFISLSLQSEMLTAATAANIYDARQKRDD